MRALLASLIMIKGFPMAALHANTRIKPLSSQPERQFILALTMIPFTSISTHILPHFKGLAEAMREDAPYAPYHTGSGRWTRIEDSWAGEQRVGWWAVS